MPNEKNITGQHISRRFDSELEDLRNQVLSMGGLVEGQVNNGIKALVDSDSGIAKMVAEKDQEINKMEVDIDESCVQILARRQPAASDLRLIVTILKTISDLERIGDQAEKLGRYHLELVDSGEKSGRYASLEHLGDLVSKLLNRCLDCFARMDDEEALKIIAMDDKINEEFDSLQRQLITHMMEDPRTIRHALRVSWCARALERVGDHAKNICEYVVFLVQGRDVRHLDLDDNKG